VARLLYAMLLGLAGAGIVHIAVLFLLPRLSERDAWSRLAAAADLYVTVAADGSDNSAPVVEAPDPQFRAVACRFDLEDGPMRVQAVGAVPYWSTSIYDRSGENVYNFNDRTAAGGALDFVVLTPAQMIEMRKDLPADLASSVFVEADLDEGMVVVRSFVPDDSWAKTIAAYLASLRCTPQQ
jgi:uncharacterized membrane protein